MKKVFLITEDTTLQKVTAQALASLDAQIDTTNRWSEAKEALFKSRYDAVCIDYDSIKIEGLDAFILLDNILQKEQTPGLLILRKPSERAKQFIASLDSFREAVDLHGAQPTAQKLAPHLRALLRDPGAADQSSAAQESDTEPTAVEVRLPSIDSGSLKTVSLARVLYALSQARHTGILELKNGTIQRRYAIYDGQPVRKAGRGYADLDMLSSAFAWQDGSYRFEVADTSEQPTIDLDRFVYTALDRHMPQRTVMQAMMPHMRAYPTLTNLWTKRRERLEALDVLTDFTAACDGETTLEKVLASLGSRATAGFKAALFAHHTDLVMLRTQPTPGGIEVQYDDAVKQARQQKVEQEKKATKAYRATGTGRLDLEQELRVYLDEIEQATPYEIFDVWEGCGREPVRKKFYEMVKSHHPDVYGGNVSGDVKRLAQEIFIAIKDAYTELLKVESEQTRPDPRGTSGLEASSETMTEPSAPTTDTLSGSKADADTSSDRLRTRRGQRKTPAPSFGAEPASTTNPSDERDAAARKSRIERLKAKRSSTPIGLGREPSTPVVQGKSRRSKRQNSADRRAKLDKIRRKSTTSTTAEADKESKAKEAFNRGYKAYRENENEEAAFRYFSTAYNLQPDSGKYMTFYGYLLFLNDADKKDEAKKVLEKAIELGDRQSLPDAHVFLGHILRVEGKERRALRHFQHALKLNPKSRAAQRELRLYKMRNQDKNDGDGSGGGFLKGLFKK